MIRVTLPSAFLAQVPTLALAPPNAERVDFLNWLSVDFKELALPADLTPGGKGPAAFLSRNTTSTANIALPMTAGRGIVAVGSSRDRWRAIFERTRRC